MSNCYECGAPVSFSFLGAEYEPPKTEAIALAALKKIAASKSVSFIFDYEAEISELKELARKAITEIEAQL